MTPAPDAPPSVSTRRFTLNPETWRRDLLRTVLRAISALGAVVYVPSVVLAVQAGLTGVVVVDTVALVVILALTWFDRLPTALRAGAGSLVLYVLGVGLLLGVGSISQIYLFGFSILTTLLMGFRWGLGSVVLNAVTLLAVGAAAVAAPEMAVPGWKYDMVGWTVITANFVMVNASLVVAIGAVVGTLESALAGAVEAGQARERESRELARANLLLEQEAQERARTEERQRRLEDQLRQAQKMETIGRLAGGIAHDFNNLLSVVLSYTELLGSELPEDDPIRADLAEIHRAGLRAVDLTGQLLAFSRQQVLQPRVVELDTIVTGMDTLLRRLLGEDVELTHRPALARRTVRVDPGQIEQVIMNLAVNARDAMPRGGRLTIAVEGVQLDERFAADHMGVTPGPHVRLEVTDTGAGMDPATQARMFEPFFTTKERGKGTGLGLATVFGIVRQSGGTIWVRSAPGEGTTFTMYFPVTEAAGEDTPDPVAQPARVGGTETILLVEDEDQVRAVTSQVLRRCGYTVLEAQNGVHALGVSSGHAGPIDLLVTDVVMPRMGGQELAQTLGPTRPSMKILFMSGYTDDAVVRHGVEEARVAFLQKPVLPDVLARKVRQVLDARPPTG